MELKLAKSAESNLYNGNEILSARKHGRKVILGSDVGCKVQAYLRKIRDEKGAVNSRVVIISARRILKKLNRSSLVEYGVSVELTKYWA